MKKATRRKGDEMRAEYDFASMKGGVRGKYVKRFRRGTNLVLLEDDVARAFPSDDAVNQALRTVIAAATSMQRRMVPSTKAGRPSARSVSRR